MSKPKEPTLTLSDFRKRCPHCDASAKNQAVYPDGTFVCTKCGKKRPPPGAN